MPEVNKKSSKQGRFVWVYLLILAGLALFIKHALQGKNVALFNPQGLIADQQHHLIAFTLYLLLGIAFLTVCLMFFIAWRYRESSPKNRHAPQAGRGKLLVGLIWLVPTSVMIVVASVMLPATRKLAPRNALASPNKPMTIQVISLRWKWLFIYPEQQVASVNFVQLPVDTPVTFEMTADETPMSSFWIPNLGGMLYTMTSHVNRLNLMAHTPGDYPGSTAEINGAGFSGMKFTARASSMDSFKSWVEQAHSSPDVLDDTTYNRLLQPSENNPVTFYSSYQNDLFGKAISKYYAPIDEEAKL